MKADVIPNNSHRLAYATGLVFHPYVVSIFTLLVILRDLAFLEALGWVVLLSGILLIPVMVILQIAKRREKYAYQRMTRTPIYISVLVSLLVCLLIIIVADGPRPLLACYLALLIWLPMQFAVNTYFTKISIHAAITAACATNFLMLGLLDNWLLVALALGVVLATGWARHTTYNHTWQQIGLGWLVGAGSVLIAYPLVL